MKTVSCALLLGACTAAAQAQSSVTIYGLIDAGVTTTSGLRDGSRRQVVSGMMDGSRLGFRGSEDLGGGWRAIFTLESRLEIDTGTVGNRAISGSQLPDRISVASRLGLPDALQPAVTAVATGIGNGVGVNLSGAFWDRQAYVGLVTPFGAVLAGRQYTPGYEIVGAYDTMNTSSSLAAGQAASLPAGTDIRVSNALAYRIQLGGISAVAMVAAGEGSRSTGRFMGLNAQYQADGYSVGLGYNARKNENGDDSLRTLTLGGTLNIGPGRLSAMYHDIEDENPSGLSDITAQLTPQLGGVLAEVVQRAFATGLRQDSRLLHVGYRYPMGLSTFYVAFTQLDDRRPANADTRTYGVAYSYALSKRTDINAVITRFDNSGAGQLAPGGGGYLGGVTASAGTDSTGVALGVRHRF